MSLGIIADTHGLLRPEAVDALRGSTHILHAGDIGPGAILTELAQIAPVTAICGNIDIAPPAADLPEEVTLLFGTCRIHMLHDVNTLTDDAGSRGWQVVVSGHSHRPDIREAGGVLYLNPGSAGPRRFRLPVTVARLDLGRDAPAAEIITLDV